MDAFNPYLPSILGYSCSLMGVWQLFFRANDRFVDFLLNNKVLSKSKQSEFLCYTPLSLGGGTYPSSFHPDITFPLQWNSLARTKRNIIRVTQPEKNDTKRRVAISLQSLCHELNLYFMTISKIQVYVVRYVQY